MRTNRVLAVAVLSASWLAFGATAGAVDCTNAKIVCNTFTKGSVKFKPVLATHPVGTCPTSVPANLEGISLKGKVSDCTVTGAPGVVVISGSVKGTIYTGDCSCTGLTVSPQPLVAPPLGKANQVVVSWKFDTTVPNTVCDDKSSIVTLDHTTGAAIKSGLFIASLASPFFNNTALYAAFNLSGAGVGVLGQFTGGTGGAGSSVTGSSTESLVTLGTSCAGVKGLKGFTFGQANTVLQ